MRASSFPNWSGAMRLSLLFVESSSNDFIAGVFLWPKVNGANLDSLLTGAGGGGKKLLVEGGSGGSRPAGFLTACQSKKQELNHEQAKTVFLSFRVYEESHS
jgi:hypothetical protein